MHKEFYSNGKLLLSGEYAVLDGALSLAIPTKHGQSLKITTTTTGFLEWESFDKTKTAWFNGSFDIKSLKTIDTTDKNVAKTLSELLVEAKSQNSRFLENSSGLKVETKLTFPKKWGLGTSSTLINNIAQWAEVDAYRLLWNAFGGSGYDIACAQHYQPILYQKENNTAHVEEVTFQPSFANSIYFVYLNQKQSSKEAITAYRTQYFDVHSLITNISTITKKMVNTTSLSEFESLMLQHEDILSEVLGLETVKSKLFADFTGAIKSLGAWGGDFIMATGGSDVSDYFKAKGFETVVPYADMVL
ncbi:GHMP kinase [Flagellimonas sp. HMM57]|uniref:GYDIA family GHMP kinase n=1 Tax=unclassified Flagellimonas TaxID=2644544 RepID=UPI0013D5E0B7|nr:MULTISPECIES: GYDIA family GHMP kinase [unclassified Flagellimonas]UII74692.1 GHMP kinase [Flagellimonas sp. HMM57]